MRRVLAGIVSGAVAVPVYLYSQNRAGLIAAGAVVLGTYRLIDWLGLLPPPFEQDVRSMLYDSADADDQDHRQN
jgi:hypothetical protein